MLTGVVRKVLGELSLVSRLLLRVLQGTTVACLSGELLCSSSHAYASVFIASCTLV